MYALTFILNHCVSLSPYCWYLHQLPVTLGTGNLSWKLGREWGVEQGWGGGRAWRVVQLSGSSQWKSRLENRKRAASPAPAP